MKGKRRTFLKTIAALGTFAAILPDAVANLPTNYNAEDRDGFTFLFQGDSITDGNRTRDSDWNHVMGHGYQYLIASKWWYDFPQKHFHFFNRGISGNKVTDLAARWQQDTLDLMPNLLSVLIGINDVSAFINGDNNFSAEQYESGYRALLNETKQTLPNIRFVLCEPFVLPVGRVKEKWNDYFSEVKKRQTAVKKMAAEYNAIHVPFQQAFNNALANAPAEYWIWDGIHPMPAGHELMAIEWMQQVTKELKFIK
jgi:lysophospholipase L1-like esterase